MNRKIIGFNALVATCLGIIIGIAAAEISRNEFASPVYQNLHMKFAIAGGILGAATGASLETIRQLKEQRDQWQDDK